MSDSVKKRTIYSEVKQQEEPNDQDNDEII